MAFNITPFKSTDDFTMAGFNGKIQEINNGVGAYANEYWWRRRIMGGSYILFKNSISTYTNSASATLTLLYSDSVSVSQEDGTITLVSPQSFTGRGEQTTLYINGHYFSYDNGATIYFAEQDAQIIITTSIQIPCAKCVSIYFEDNGPWEYIHSPNRNAYPDSGTQDGYEYEYLGIPFDNAVNGVKIETGSYVGTGTYGASNPNTLTFGFTPKMVFMTDGANSFDDRYTLFFPWLESITALNINRLNQDGYALSTTISGNTISWFNGHSADFQWNTANHKYCYLAIG